MRLYVICADDTVSKKPFASLCQQGADLEFTYNGSHEELTLLMLAALNRNIMIPLLLAQGANINATNKNGKTALMIAAYHGRYF